MAHNDLHDLLSQIHLAGQSPLAQGHMEQRAHLFQKQGRQRPVEGDPEAAGFLDAGKVSAGLIRRDHRSFAGAQLHRRIIPADFHFALLHTEPHPLAVAADGHLIPRGQKHAARRVNPHAGLLGQRIRFMKAFNQNTLLLLRNGRGFCIEEIVWHGYVLQQ